MNSWEILEEIGIQTSVNIFKWAKVVLIDKFWHHSHSMVRLVNLQYPENMRGNSNFGGSIIHAMELEVSYATVIGLVLSKEGIGGDVFERSTIVWWTTVGLRWKSGEEEEESDGGYGCKEGDR